MKTTAKDNMIHPGYVYNLAPKISKLGFSQGMSSQKIDNLFGLYQALAVSHLKLKTNLPILAPSSCLHLHPQGGTFYVRLVPIAQVNSPGARVLELCNGSNKTANIISRISEEFNMSFSNAEKSVKSFLIEGVIQQQVSFKEKDQPGVITGDPNRWLPYLFDIEFTRKCRFHCCNCYFDEKNTHQLNMDKLIGFLKLFYSLKGASIYIKSLPASNRDLLRFLEFCETSDISEIRILFRNDEVTNDLVNELKHFKKIHDIRMPIFGSDSRTNRLVTGSSGFLPNTLDAVVKLAANGFPTALLMQILRGINENEIEKTAKAVKKAGGNEIRIRLLMPPNRKQLRQLEITYDQMIELRKIAKQVSQEMNNEEFEVYIVAHKYLDLILESRYSHVFSLKEKDEILKAVPGFSRGCRAGQLIIHISANGIIKPCSSFPDYFKIGNIYTKPVEQVYEKMNHFINLPYPTLDTCKECKLFYSCFYCPAKMLYNRNYVNHCHVNEELRLWKKKNE